MRTKPCFFISIFLLVAVFFWSCKNKPVVDTQYSVYKPILMSRSDLVNSVAIEPSRSMDTVFKVGFIGDWLVVGETYWGIHVLDNSDPRDVKELAFISIPGITDFIVKDSVIFANNAVDLVAIKLVSPTQIQVLDREQEVFGELQPPDGRKVNPLFMKGKRPDKTEIIAWVRDKNIGLNSDSTFLVTNLLASDRDHVFALIGQSAITYQITGGKLTFKSLTKANYDNNYRMLYFDGHLMFLGNNSLRVFSVGMDNLVFLNEYSGVNPTNYFAFTGQPGNYIMAASFHYAPVFWSSINQVEIYHVGSFDGLNLDTVLRLTYPLDVRFDDSLLLVCDQGIKVFRYDSLFRQVFYEPADAQVLFQKDSLLVSIGEITLSQYILRGDSLSLVWHKPIEFSWVNN